MNKAIFLDRDGTIIKDKGHVGDTSDVYFYDYTFDCLRELQKDFLLFIVTNQPGISKGIISKSNVEKVHAFIIKKLKDNGVEIKEIYYCPHNKEDHCLCRKPHTFFIDQTKDKYSINIHDSYVIGDHPSDAEFAINAKAHGIYLLTGHGRKHYHELTASKRTLIKTCFNLQFATKFILKQL